MAAAVVAVLAIAGCGSSGSVFGGHASASSPTPQIAVQARPVSRPTPAGFVGLSMEYRGFAAYAGPNPLAVDPVFEQLIRDIAPDQSPVLRIGGDGTDWSWWPVPGVKQPLGIKYSITPAYLGTVRAFAKALNARVIMGINLEADSERIAATEAAAIVGHVGLSAIEALEIGNEPELYSRFGWYRSAAGLEVPGRPPGYDEADYQRDFTAFAAGIPGAPLAGPSSGAVGWLTNLGEFLGAEPRVRLATIHAYPLKHCTPSEVVTAAQLLSDQSSDGLAALVSPYLVVATRHGIPLRVDEMNGISCGGYKGVSNTFASALWLLDTLFAMDKLGVSGVNVHTVPGSTNEILGPGKVDGHWQIVVHPEYYGAVMFAQAAPPGSRILALSAAAPAGVKVWATSSPDGHIRVVVIDKRLAGGASVSLQIPGASGPAKVEQLLAPSLAATGGVTLGGQTFGAATTTGVLSGTPSSRTLAPASGRYVVTLPAPGATMLTFTGS